MGGFEAGERELPGPVVDVAADVRERLIVLVAAIIHGRTPEEIAPYVGGESVAWSTEVLERLQDPGEREELSAHIDLILSVLQSPVEAGA